MATRIVAPIIVLVVGALVVKVLIDDRPATRAASATPERPEQRPVQDPSKEITQIISTDGGGNRGWSGAAVVDLPPSRRFEPAVTTPVERLGPIVWDAPIADAFEFRSADVRCSGSSGEVEVGLVAKIVLHEGSPVTTGQALVYDDRGILLDETIVFIRKEERYRGRPGWEPNMTGFASFDLIGWRCPGGLGVALRTGAPALDDIAKVVVQRH